MTVFPVFLSFASGLFHVMGQLSGALRVVALRVVVVVALAWIVVVVGVLTVSVVTLQARAGPTLLPI